MITVNFARQNYSTALALGVKALRRGRAVVYPTDTSYGLAVDATNIQAVKRLYKIKGRNFHKPVHVVAPSSAYVKKIVEWPRVASKLSKKFWPGPLTLVLPLKIGDKGLRILSAASGYLGVRMPNNKIATDLARHLKAPITATSANRSGQPDCYSPAAVRRQFRRTRFQPDIIFDGGSLKKTKPSTLVKIQSGAVEILRLGPITKKQILQQL